MKTNQPLLLITVLFLFGVKTILACDCRTRGTTLEEFQNNAAVFSGKVISENYQEMTDPTDRDFGLEVLFIKIKTDRWWKGSGDSEVIMRTDRVKINGGIRRTDCDYFFTQKESYLVFANFYNGLFKAGICSKTKKLSEAEEDLKDLGEGSQPNEPLSILETDPEFLSSYAVFFH